MLCRLFRKAELKQDENTESSNVNEVEEIISSPTTEVKSSAEDEQSESVTPSTDGPIGKQQSSVKTSNSEKVIFDTHVPIDWQSCIPHENEDCLFDITSIPVSERAEPNFLTYLSLFIYLFIYLFLYDSYSA